MFTYIYIHMYIYAYIIYKHVYIHFHKYTCTSYAKTYTHVHIQTYICIINIGIYTYICSNIYICMYMSTWIYHKHRHVYIYETTEIQTRMRIHRDWDCVWNYTTLLQETQGDLTTGRVDVHGEQEGSHNQPHKRGSSQRDKPTGRLSPIHVQTINSHLPPA